MYNLRRFCKFKVIKISSMGLKRDGLWVWLSIALILVIQLSLIAFWVEPYPNWGDDLSYILFFDIRISDVF